MPTQNFYEILKCAPTANFEELRRNYKQLILQFHPDKYQPANTNTLTTTTTTYNTNFDNTNHTTNTTNAEIPMVTSSNQHCSEFVAINEAWSTLKDPTKRRLYDAELMLTKFQAHSNIFARLTLADMKRCADTTATLATPITTTTAKSGSGSDCDISGTYYYYTYDCRCGGQYIVDESADSEILHSNHNSTATNDSKRHNPPPQEEQKMQEKQMSHDNDNDKASNQAVAYATEPIIGSGSGSSRKNETTGDDEDIRSAVDADDGDDDDGEVLVECSECSLVIVLT